MCLLAVPNRAATGATNAGIDTAYSTFMTLPTLIKERLGKWEMLYGSAELCHETLAEFMKESYSLGIERAIEVAEEVTAPSLSPKLKRTRRGVWLAEYGTGHAAFKEAKCARAFKDGYNQAVVDVRLASLPTLQKELSSIREV